MPTRKARRLVASALVLAVAIGAVPPAAHADSIGDKRAEAQQIATKLAELQQQEGVFTERFNAAQERLGRLQSEVRDAKQRVATANATIRARRADVAEFAVNDYVAGSGGGNDVVQLLRSDPSDWGQRQSYASVAIGDRQTLLNDLAVAKDDASQQTAALDRAIAEADGAKQDAQSERDSIEQALADEKALNDEVQGELAELVAQEQARQAAEQQRLAEEKVRREAEAARAATPPPAPANEGEQAPRGAAPTTAPPAATPAPSPAATPSTSPPTAPAPTPPSPGPAVGGDARTRIVQAAESQVGVPYVYGGEEPGVGFDCSGLVQWAYGQAGISTPRVATDQLHSSRRIPISELQPGDLVFYNGNESFMGHVAIYVGNGQIVQALHSGSPVMYSSLYFWDAIAGAGTYF